MPIEDQPSHPPSSPSSSEASEKSDKDEAEFGKGVVLYKRDGEVVGVVLWNLFNRTSIARRAVSEGWKVTDDDVAEMGRRFRVFE